MTRDHLPKTVTTYDLLKIFAVVTMLIDHVGYYFYPDELWFRAVGRVSFPVWLFLIGYARNRDLSPRLWAGMGFLVLMNVACGMAIFPLNILALILIVRIALDPLMARLEKAPAILWPFLAMLTALVLPTNYIVEYGTLGLMFAMLGYYVRREGGSGLESQALNAFALAVGLVYVVFEGVLMGFGRDQFLVMAVGVMAVTLGLLYFQPRSYPSSINWPGPVLSLLRLCGRHSLEIYVAHLTLFKIVALALGLPGYALFHHRLF